MSYAEKTSVPIERSKAEIEKILAKYGATAFAYASDQEKAMVRFVMKERQVMFLLPLPEFAKFLRDGRGSRRSPQSQREAWEQGCRSKWRALALAIKAKLEAVESGITSFEDEFLSHIMLPNGRTAGDWLKPQIESAYQNNKMPPLLGYSP